MTNSRPEDGAEASPKAQMENPGEKRIPPTSVIPPDINEALRSVGVDPLDPRVTKTLEISFSMMMARGTLPLPPAQVLLEYNSVYPEMAAKIIGWTEEQRKHR